MTNTPSYNTNCRNNGSAYCSSGFQNTPGCWAASGCSGCTGRTDLMPHYIPYGYNGNASAVLSDGGSKVIWHFNANPFYENLWWQGAPDYSLRPSGQCWYSSSTTQHPCYLDVGAIADTSCGQWNGGGAFTGITTMFVTQCQNGQWPCNLAPDCLTCSQTQIGPDASDPGSLPDYSFDACTGLVGPGQQYLCAQNITPGCSTFDGVGGTDGQRPSNPWDYTPQVSNGGGGSSPDYGYWYDGWRGIGQVDSMNTQQQHVLGIDFSSPRPMGYGLGTVDAMTTQVQNPSFGFTPCEYNINNFDWTMITNFNNLVSSGILPGLKKKFIRE